MRPKVLGLPPKSKSIGVEDIIQERLKRMERRSREGSVDNSRESSVDREDFKGYQIKDFNDSDREKSNGSSKNSSAVNTPSGRDRPNTSHAVNNKGKRQKDMAQRFNLRTSDNSNSLNKMKEPNPTDFMNSNSSTRKSIDENNDVYAKNPVKIKSSKDLT